MNDVGHLQGVAKQVREEVLWMSARASTPHVAGALSCVEALVALYFSELYDLSSEQILDGSSDVVIFSKGHAISVMYATLAEAGVLPRKLLTSFNQDGGPLPEQPSMGSVPGITWATGSLGHGLSVGLGIALGLRNLEVRKKVIVIMSDGECEEGSVWEAIALAAHHKMENLLVLIDANGWQATDRVSNVTNLNPIAPKLEAFGWKAKSVDGSDISSIVEALWVCKSMRGAPQAIVLNTIKGQGVAEIEDDNNWHYRSPTLDEVKLFLNKGLT